AKSAPDALPLHLELQPVEGGARDHLSATLEGLLAFDLLRRRQGDSMVVQRASVWLTPSGSEPARLPERPGTLIYGSLASFDWDRWRPLFEKGDSPAADTLSLDLKIGVLDAYAKRVHDMALRGSVEAAGWSAAVQSQEIS